MRLIFALLVFALIFSGCAAQQQAAEPDGKAEAIGMCQEACQKALAAKQNISRGPCLLNPIPQQPDWACDIAHSPRTDSDNLPENQCEYFRRGLSTHFVELSEDCGFLRAV